MYVMPCDLYLVGVPIADDSAKKASRSVQLIVWVVMQEADFIIHAVDQALQQLALPSISRCLHQPHTACEKSFTESCILQLALRSGQAISEGGN